MLETVLAAVTEAVLGYALAESGLSERVRRTLQGDPQQQAFKAAFARAYITFSQQHPRWATTLFDAPFLTGAAAPVLARCLRRDSAPPAADLAAAYVQHTGLRPAVQQQYATELETVAGDLLHLLTAELRARPEFQSLYDSRAHDATATNTAEIADLLRQLLDVQQQAQQQPHIQIVDHSVRVGHVNGNDIAIGTGATVRSGDDAPPPPRTSYPPNPFGDSGRITDPARFHGREMVLHELFEKLARGGSVSLVGDSQVGKSSLLAMVEHLKPRYHAPFPALAGYSVHHINMQTIMDDDDFFACLCDELGVPDALRGGLLARQLRRQGVRAIVCLDEIEKMQRETFSEDSRDLLRGLADGADTPLTLVIASRLPLDVLFPDSPGKTSPLYNLCQPALPLGAFPPAEARSLLAARLHGTGVTFTAAEVATLLQQSACHPARLQHAAAVLYRQKTVS